MAGLELPLTQLTTSHRAKGFALVLLAAALWGTLGIFYKILIGVYGLSPLCLAFFRAAFSAVFLLVGLALWQPGCLRVARRDLPLLVGFGLFGVAAFFFVYVNAVDRVGVAVASVLLYTAPAWVTLISWRFLGERIGRRPASGAGQQRQRGRQRGADGGDSPGVRDLRRGDGSLADAGWGAHHRRGDH